MVQAGFPAWNDALQGQAGWIGLGAMGKHMAGHVAKNEIASGRKLKVWNRTTARAEEHVAAYGSECVTDFEAFNDCGIVFLSLPTTAQVADICGKLNLKANAIIVDTTSGDPTATIEVSNMLKAKGVHMVDCPVSGGPKGAENGALATMLGGEKDLCAGVRELLLKTFSGKSVVCGPIGSGMAVKAINNTMNMAHVQIAAEGLLALRNYGVEPDTALSVINASSGRSLATTERLPESVLTGKFDFGFALALMSKDCRIGGSLMKEHFPTATLLPEVVRLAQECEAKTPQGDYTEACKLFEERAKNNLQVQNPNL